MTAPQRRAGRAWRNLRAQVLAGDPWCALCGRRPATTVDHIRPIALGGDEMDIENLRPACAPCNYSSGASLGNRMRAAKAQPGQPVTPYTAPGLPGPDCPWRPGRLCYPACDNSPLPVGCGRQSELRW